MKRSCKKVKANSYIFGGITNFLKNKLTTADGNLNQAGNITNAITNLGSSLIPSSGNARTDAITNGIAGGLQAVGSAFGPLGSAIGSAAGMLTKGLGAMVGTKDTVNTDTGEYIKGKGIKGRKSREDAMNQWRRVNQGISDANATAMLREEYANQYGENDYSLAAYGGILPNTLAYLDDGELIRTPDGQISSIPEEGKPTDSNLVNVPVGTQVLSDTLKVPGTNKTFAEMGQKLMKTGKKKGNDIYAQNSQMLNERNNQQKYNELMELQEQVKAKKRIKDKNIPKYDIGTSGINNVDPNKRMYFDPFTQLIDATFQGIDDVLGLGEQSPYTQEARLNMPRLQPRVSRWNRNRIQMTNRNTPTFQNEVRPTGKGSEITKQKNIARRQRLFDTWQQGKPFEPVQSANTSLSKDNLSIAKMLDPKSEMTFTRTREPFDSEDLISIARGATNLPVKYNPAAKFDLDPEDAMAVGALATAGSYIHLMDDDNSNSANNSPTTQQIENALIGNRPQYYAERNLNLFGDGPAIQSGLMRAGWSHGNPVSYDLNYVGDMPHFDLSQYSYGQSSNGRAKTSSIGNKTNVVEQNQPITKAERKDLAFVKQNKTNLSVSVPKAGETKLPKREVKSVKSAKSSMEIPNFASLIGPLANIYDSTPEQAPIRTYTPHFAPTEYDVTPILNEIDRTNAIARYNVNRAGGAGTGANLAQAVQSQVARNRAIAEAYNQKDNIETQRQAANAGIYNDWARFNAEAFHRGDVENAQNRAAARNARRTGISQLGTALQSMDKDRRLTNRDKAVLDFMKPFLEYGAPSSNLSRIYNYYKI